MNNYSYHQNKLFAYFTDLKESYKNPQVLANGLTRNPYDVIKRIIYYTNNAYLSGDKDLLGREKPFYNIVNYRATIAKTSTDLDVKDIRFEADSLKYSVQAMIFNHELYKQLKKMNFSKFLNDFGTIRPKFGGTLVKKYETEDDLDISVVDWNNVEFNPANILGSPICETHYLTPEEVTLKSDVWDSVDDLLEEYSKSKTKNGLIEIKEYSGEFPAYLYPDAKEGESKYRYKRMRFITACHEGKDFLLDYGYEDEQIYKYLSWEEVGNGLGKGIIEDGFEAQTSTNDAIINIKNAVEAASKVVVYTDSTTLSGNVLNDVVDGQLLKLTKGDQIGQLSLGATNLPAYQGIINLWENQYNRTASTYEANTGEAPTAGTPYSQTALLNQVANTPFEYQREVAGIFISHEIINDWVLKFLKKKILKPHYLMSEFSDKELSIIDESIVEYNTKIALKNTLINEKRVLNPKELEDIKYGIKTVLSKFGSKRELRIPEGYLDIEGQLTCNITGELKNKAVILQSLDSIFKTVASTFNPNTGEFAALSDPTLKQIFGQIVELAGVPISFSSIEQNIRPVQLPDISAISQQIPNAELAT